MRLYGIRVFVDDFAPARRFYGHTLGLEERWAMPEVGVAGYALGDATLIVEVEDPNGEDGHLVGRFVGISIAVDDMDQSYRALFDKGVHFAGPPVKQVWGGTLAHFRDPAGNTLTLLSD
ncbi:MAG: VOC family protein [Pseudomonadota bacterium]